MKITIDLTESQVKGIKEYLKDTSGDINPKIGKAEIKEYIDGLVNAMYAEAAGDYIIKYENS